MYIWVTPAGQRMMCRVVWGGMWTVARRPVQGVSPGGLRRGRLLMMTNCIEQVPGTWLGRRNEIRWSCPYVLNRYCRVLCCCGVVLVVSCIVLFLLCVCVCDLFLFLQTVFQSYSCGAATRTRIPYSTWLILCMTKTRTYSRLLQSRNRLLYSRNRLYLHITPYA